MPSKHCNLAKVNDHKKSSLLQGEMNEYRQKLLEEQSLTECAAPPKEEVRALLGCATHCGTDFGYIFLQAFNPCCHYCQQAKPAIATAGLLGGYRAAAILAGDRHPGRLGGPRQAGACPADH